MTREKIVLLQKELLGLQLAAGHLEIYATVVAMSPTLLAVVPKVIAYADNTIRRYPE